MLLPDVATCTCNPSTLEAKFQNGVGLMPIGGNNSSIGGWIERTSSIQPKEKSLTKYVT